MSPRGTLERYRKEMSQSLSLGQCGQDLQLSKTRYRESGRGWQVRDCHEMGVTEFLRYRYPESEKLIGGSGGCIVL